MALRPEQCAKDRGADGYGGAHLHAGGLLALHLHGLFGLSHPDRESRPASPQYFSRTFRQRGVTRFARHLN